MTDRYSQIARAVWKWGICSWYKWSRKHSLLKFQFWSSENPFAEEEVFQAGRMKFNLKCKFFKNVYQKPLIVFICDVKVHGELLQAVKGLEESLLHLKRARLLREVDAMTQQEVAAPISLSNEVVNNSIHSVPSTDLVDLNFPESFSVGSKCCFRHTDGRWYNGFIVNMESESIARVSFLHPTSEKMRVGFSTYLLLWFYSKTGYRFLYLFRGHWEMHTDIIIQHIACLGLLNR